MHKSVHVRVCVQISAEVPRCGRSAVGQQQLQQQQSGRCVEQQRECGDQKFQVSVWRVLFFGLGCSSRRRLFLYRSSTNLSSHNPLSTLSSVGRNIHYMLIMINGGGNSIHPSSSLSSSLLFYLVEFDNIRCNMSTNARTRTLNPITFDLIFNLLLGMHFNCVRSLLARDAPSHFHRAFADDFGGPIISHRVCVCVCVACFV